MFECKVKHDPSLIPTMTWLKDNGELPDDERYLFTYVHMVHDDYQCNHVCSDSITYTTEQ